MDSFQIVVVFPLVLFSYVISFDNKALYKPNQISRSLETKAWKFLFTSLPEGGSRAQIAYRVCLTPASLVAIFTYWNEVILT